MASIDRYRPTREEYKPPPLRESSGASGASGAPGTSTAHPASAVLDRMAPSSPSRRSVPPAVPSPPVSSLTSPPRPYRDDSQSDNPHRPRPTPGQQQHGQQSKSKQEPPRASHADASSSQRAARAPSAVPQPPGAPAPPRGPTPFVSQWYYTEDEIVSTPSVLHGLTPAEERERRAKGVNFIYQAGCTVQPQALPQVTIFAAAVFFHRFFMRYSLVEKRGGVHHYNIAATALFLANKTEENCFKTKHLIVAFAKVAQKNPKLVVDEQSKEYWRWRDSVLAHEELMLEILTFDLNISNPYDQLWKQLRTLGQLGSKPVREAAWAFLNDSVLTALPLQLDARDLATASIFFASVVSKQKLGDVNGQRWWQAVRGDEARIVRATQVLVAFYLENPLINRHAGIRNAATKAAADMSLTPSAHGGGHIVGSPVFHLEKTRLPLDPVAGMYDGTARPSASREVTPMELDRAQSTQPKPSKTPDASRVSRVSDTPAKSAKPIKTDAVKPIKTEHDLSDRRLALSDVAAAPGDSDVALKNAANNLDTGLHPHAPSQSVSQSVRGTTPSTHKTNGKRAMEEGELESSPPAAKRPRTSLLAESPGRDRDRDADADADEDADEDVRDYRPRSPRFDSQNDSPVISTDGSRSLSYDT